MVSLGDYTSGLGSGIDSGISSFGSGGGGSGGGFDWTSLIAPGLNGLFAGLKGGPQQTGMLGFQPNRWSNMYQDVGAGTNAMLGAALGNPLYADYFGQGGQGGGGNAAAALAARSASNPAGGAGMTKTMGMSPMAGKALSMPSAGSSNAPQGSVPPGGYAPGHYQESVDALNNWGAQNGISLEGGGGGPLAKIFSSLLGAGVGGAFGMPGLGASVGGSLASLSGRKPDASGGSGGGGGGNPSFSGTFGMPLNQGSVDQFTQSMMGGRNPSGMNTVSGMGGQGMFGGGYQYPPPPSTYPYTKV